MQRFKPVCERGTICQQKVTKWVPFLPKIEGWGVRPRGRASPYKSLFCTPSGLNLTNPRLKLHLGIDIIESFRSRPPVSGHFWIRNIYLFFFCPSILSGFTLSSSTNLLKKKKKRSSAHAKLFLLVSFNNCFVDKLVLVRPTLVHSFTHEKTHSACTVSIPESSIQFVIILL